MRSMCCSLASSIGAFAQHSSCLDSCCAANGDVFPYLLVNIGSGVSIVKVLLVVYTDSCSLSHLLYCCCLRYLRPPRTSRK